MSEITNQDYVNQWTNMYNNAEGRPEIENFNEVLNDLFLYEVAPNRTQIARIHTFKLSGLDLMGILKVNTESPNNQMRLHLAATPVEILQSTHIDETPAFNLVVDAYRLSSGEEGPHFNNLELSDSKLMSAVIGSEIPEAPSETGDGVITKGNAKVMTNAFKTDFPALGLQPSKFADIFLGTDPGSNKKQFVNGFTVGKEGTNLIANNITSNKFLYVHLGYLPEKYEGRDLNLPPGDLFRFRCVLQIRDTQSSGRTRDFYLEFANPCPPSCRGEFIEGPLGDPIPFLPLRFPPNNGDKKK